MGIGQARKASLVRVAIRKRPRAIWRPLEQPSEGGQLTQRVSVGRVDCLDHGSAKSILFVIGRHLPACWLRHHGNGMDKQERAAPVPSLLHSRQSTIAVQRCPLLEADSLRRDGQHRSEGTTSTPRNWNTVLSLYKSDHPGCGFETRVRFWRSTFFGAEAARKPMSKHDSVTKRTRRPKSDKRVY
jgi:hypothetical protein